MTQINLLIDADVVAYNAAASCEKATDWGDGFWTWHCDFDAVIAKCEERIADMVETFSADSIVLCLTDSDHNFRKDVLPTYKGNRVSTKKPMVLKAVKQWMIDEHDAYLKPTLEGDDCMGILATRRPKPGVQNIIVSIDKDMKTIPGHFSRDGKTVQVISEPEADWWHFYQTLTGDTTDGYSGCPAIGPKTAEKIIGSLDDYIANPDPAAAWAAIVAAFTKAKLGANEALTQARVARILRASDYDFIKKEPILWMPPC